MAETVSADIIGKLREAVAGLEKNDLFIAEWVTAGRNDDLVSPTLQQLCAAILAFASTI